MVKCDNLCEKTEQLCEYCKANYDVSSEFYSAENMVTSKRVYGYLVKSKNNNTIGILNVKTKFSQVAFIKPDTLRLERNYNHYKETTEYKDGYKRGFDVGFEDGFKVGRREGYGQLPLPTEEGACNYPVV